MAGGAVSSLGTSYMASTNFDKVPNRRGTGSFKWDHFDQGDTLPFWVADMDFESPPEVIEALQAQVAHGVFGYACAKREEKGAVLEYLYRAHRIQASGAWLVWLPGLVPSLSVAAAVAKERGAASSLCSTPVYPPFLSSPGDAGLESLSVPLCQDAIGRWTFDREALEATVRPDTGLFVLCNPHNPVGTVFTREELDWLGDFCERHDLLLCSDEIHCDLILDEEKTPHVSALHLSESLRERTIVLMAASKTYNIAGIGCAYALIPDGKLRTAYRKASGGWLPPVNVFGYVATEAAYRHGEPWRQDLVEYLRGNHVLLAKYLREHHPELSLTPAEATYLAWLDVRPLEIEKPQPFFQKHGLTFSNGVDFGAPGYLRWNLGCTRALLKEGLERFTGAIRSIS